MMFTHAARVAPERTDLSARLAVVPFLRSDRERSMGKTYGEKLRDPRWQRKRLEVLARDDWKCTMCDDRTSTLHVHHAYYVSAREPWDYPLQAYHSLCETCHERYPQLGAALVDEIVRARGLLLQGPADGESLTEIQAARLAVHGVEMLMDARVGVPPHRALVKACINAVRTLAAIERAHRREAARKAPDEG